jgi:hypothetical protein
LSVQVLMAVVDMDLFKQMSEEETTAATAALVREIQSDPELKQRLYNAVASSAQDLVGRQATKGS